MKTQFKKTKQKQRPYAPHFEQQNTAYLRTAAIKEGQYHERLAARVSGILADPFLKV